ncbi:unnamed protein product [Linum trigynum]|uniref:Gag-pol polyprotein n=1 Tax=Linum trigynum TaxID=586398 RepID=A0AAV2E9F7_9ROSI
MASGSGSGAVLYLADGFSQNRPPRFEGVNYGYWKNRMELFIGSTDPKIWDRFLDGPLEVKANRSKWTDEDRDKHQQNCKATNLMYCALGSEEYHKVSGCKTAKEIWDKLQVTYEGTSQVKISRINSLKTEFELFKMMEGETIRQMYERFRTTVNSLENMGISYESGDLVRKLLWSLPTKWEAKVTAIEEAKDLSKLPVDELIGSLTTYEEKIIRESREEQKKEKRGIAFRTQVYEEECDSYQDMDDDELAMLSNHISQLMRMRKERR